MLLRWTCRAAWAASIILGVLCFIAGDDRRDDAMQAVLWALLWGFAELSWFWECEARKAARR